MFTPSEDDGEFSTHREVFFTMDVNSKSQIGDFSFCQFWLGLA